MADLLFDEWRTYQKLLENDYLGHAGFFQRLKLEIQRCFDGPISILDLGCGDVSPILSLLHDLNVSNYCGVDKTDTALVKAEANLASLGIPSQLYAGDLLDALPTLRGQYDLIVASFSLHHLQTAVEKGQVLKKCLPLLKPAGLVAIIDAFHAEDEVRDDYVNRWIAFVKDTYTALDSHELEQLFEHTRNCDFPESLSTYRALAKEAGYRGFNTLLHDTSHFCHLLTLTQ